MIYGKLNDFEAMGLVPLGEAVSFSVAWIRMFMANPKEGCYTLDEHGLYAVVMRYATGNAAESRFETHRRHVDLQYTLSGAEAIDWAPRDSLAGDGGYDAAKEVLFHRPGPVFGTVVKSAGFFSMYTPVDAHRPKIRVDGHAEVFKLVVKIPVSRFTSQ